jgi:hypothetical protein
MKHLLASLFLLFAVTSADAAPVPRWLFDSDLRVGFEFEWHTPETTWKAVITEEFPDYGKYGTDNISPMNWYAVAFYRDLELSDHPATSRTGSIMTSSAEIRSVMKLRKP